jgi:hypothetical protein
MRRLAVLAGCVVVLALPSAASAAIPQVFTNTATPITCTVQSAGVAAGQRFCGTGTARVSSYDNAPVDTVVALPPVPASGPDGNFPIVGIFHGWGGSKIVPGTAASTATTSAQHWLSKGYAVISITDRGWGQSCGLQSIPKPAACSTAPAYPGSIHLLHNAYEVRDVQYLLGLLADQGVIDPVRIGAVGGSYGGGMSLALGALKDRVQLPDGTLVPWTSPINNIPLTMAATAPEFPWSDIAATLLPNGGTLDYAAYSPYFGPNGDRGVGIQKQNWNGTLYNAGALLGYYAPNGANPAADMMGWNAAFSTGGPFGAGDVAKVNELTSNHSAYYVDDSEAPAPALLSSGWNDDLFPANETLRYYNKIRADHPTAPIRIFDLDFGHNPRAATPVASDVAALNASEDAWFDYYILGQGSTPANAAGGVTIRTSRCPATTPGTQYSAADWASLAPGEIRYAANAAKTITAPGTAPSNAFTSGDVCTTTSSADNATAATYRLPPAPGGYTLAGSPTVTADILSTGANDALIARLYVIRNGGATENLIGRAPVRPLGVGTATWTPQVFQLYPQAMGINAGDVIKLELLSADSPYARTSVGQQSVQVRNLQLRLPTIDAPGALGGTIQAPAPKYLPAGYTLARGYSASTGATSTDSTVLGHVDEMLALTVDSSSSSLGTFVPGTAASYTTSLTATVTSTAGASALSVVDPDASDTTRGRLVHGAFTLLSPLNVRATNGANPATAFAPLSSVAATPLTLLTWGSPTTSDPVSLQFKQAIGANEGLRTGTYNKTVTFTVSATTP